MLKRLYANPATMICIAIFIVIFGIVKFMGIPLALYPNASRVVLNVALVTPSMDSQDFYREYGKNIEQKLLGLNQIDDVTASYKDGRADWNVIFAWGADKEKLRTDVKAVLDSFRPFFPKEWYNFHTWFDENTRILMTVASDKYDDDKLWKLVKDSIKPDLAQISGFDNIFVTKHENAYLKIELDYQRMLELGLTSQEVESALMSKKLDHMLPKVESKGGQNFSLNLLLKDHSLESIKQTIVALKGSKQIRLSELAKVYTTSRLPSTIFKGNGEPSVLVGGTISSDANISSVCQAFIKTVNTKAKLLDTDVKLQILTNPNEFIQEAVINVGESVLMGIGIATLILFLFLSSFRLTLVVSIAIPLSLIGGFIFMDFFGIEINLISLGAMALSVGMVVDGSIVVLENCDRHLRMQTAKGFAQRLNVIYEAVFEVRSAVFASLLTTIIVFVPLSFTAPLANAILGDLARVIVCVLVISVFVTILFVPPLILSLGFSSADKKQGLYRIPALFSVLVNQLQNAYLLLLSLLLHHKGWRRLWFSGLLLTILATAYLISQKVEREILATPDSNKVWLWVRFPNQDLDANEIEKRIKPVERVLATEFKPYVKEYTSMNYGRGAGLLCSLYHKKDLKLVKKLLEDRFENSTKVRYWVKPWNPTSLEIPKPPLLDIHLTGQNLDEKMQMMKKLEALVRSQAEQQVGRVKFYPRVKKAEEFRLVPNSSYLKHIEANFGPKLSQWEHLISLLTKPREITQVKFDGIDEELGLELGFAGSLVEHPEHILNVLVSLGEKLLPLRYFFDLNSDKKWQEFYTEHGAPVYRVEVHMKESATEGRDSLSLRLKQAIIDDPEIDHSLLSFADTDIEINQNIYSLLLALLLALSLIWIVISLQFGSMKQTLVIMCAIPLGFIGVSLSLYVFSAKLSVNSMLGMILLCGTAVNNSIIYVDFYNQRRKESVGLSLNELLLEVAALRFKPIMITTATTILGMLPIAFGFGSGGEILQPLGIAVCGGLSLSSLLTLLTVPLIISCMPSQKKLVT